MKILKSIESKQTKKKIELINKEVKSLEAYRVIIALINDKIDALKLKRLQKWVGDHNCDTEQIDRKIKDLINEKHQISSFVNKNRGLGKKLKMNGMFEISLLD